LWTWWLLLLPMIVRRFTEWKGSKRHSPGLLLRRRRRLRISHFSDVPPTSAQIDVGNWPYDFQKLSLALLKIRSRGTFSLELYTVNIAGGEYIALVVQVECEKGPAQRGLVAMVVLTVCCVRRFVASLPSPVNVVSWA
jgi:hypothetical protein